MVLFVSRFLGTQCNDVPFQRTAIKYDRQYLLHLAEAPASSTTPPDLPEWIPTRDDQLSPEQTRKRGKRGGVRQRVRKRGHRPPLPSITLSNVRSLSNKMDELRANIRYNNEFRNTSLICLTETWLTSDISTNTIDIPGFGVVRHDRSYESSNKSNGGGLCVFFNKQWCNNAKIRYSICSENLELLCVSFRPFYLPREFTQLHVFVVYIPPDADAGIASTMIQTKVNEMEDQAPDSPKIVLGDFNHCRLEDTMPHYHQHIDRPTRGGNILDRC